MNPTICLSIAAFVISSNVISGNLLIIPNEQPYFKALAQTHFKISCWKGKYDKWTDSNTTAICPSSIFKFCVCVCVCVCGVCVCVFVCVCVCVLGGGGGWGFTNMNELLQHKILETSNKDSIIQSIKRIFF